MRIFASHLPTLLALGGSKIELTIGVPNEGIQSICIERGLRQHVVQTYLKKYPGLKFHYIGVGNEIQPLSPVAGFVLPTMENLYAAVSGAGLSTKVKVSTMLRCNGRDHYRGDHL